MTLSSCIDLDRSNLGNARLQGLPEDALGGDPTGKLFDVVNSVFFITYVRTIYLISFQRIHRFVDTTDRLSNPCDHRFKALPTTVVDGERCHRVGNFLNPHGKHANYNNIFHADPHLSQRRSIILALLFADCSWVSSKLHSDLGSRFTSVRQFQTGSIRHNQHLSKHSFILSKKWVFG